VYGWKRWASFFVPEYACTMAIDRTLSSSHSAQTPVDATATVVVLVVVLVVPSSCCSEQDAGLAKDFVLTDLTLPFQAGNKTTRICVYVFSFSEFQQRQTIGLVLSDI
jgi:hypothetical protein